jgi:peptide-methionine (S)-S-oxide reductase
MELSVATLAGGCFWCLEAVYLRAGGIERAVSGYMGGHVDHPTYRAVCTGKTGHAEVVQLHYDPARISFRELLEIFFTIHDPTTLNRQGNDVGSQYRSAIFYHNEEQREQARALIAELTAGAKFRDPIVTEVTAATTFYPAEDYHQNYFDLNGEQPYCRFVVAPKVRKFEQVFGERHKV